ncbi:MAG: sulfite exporter TauE/SafE family protein [Planctomycetes bacterium]|nr:sulfite exporter TauE/SafE family protein [Planctomycetota bacterium]
MSWIALALGAAVGLVLGLLGGGGSVLAIPLLTYGLGLEAKPAVATSLFVVGVAALVGSGFHARSGRVHFKVALAFGVLGGLGGLLGSQLARLIPGTAQLVLFAAIMLFAGVRMLRHEPSEEGRDLGEEPAHEAAAATPRASGWAIAAAALATGVLTGVVGVGGGFLIVPALVLLVQLPMRDAIGTSLLVIVLNAVGGSLGYLAYVSLDLSIALPFALGAGALALVGGALSQRLSPRWLQVVFAVGILVMGVGMLLKEGLALLTPS